MPKTVLKSVAVVLCLCLAAALLLTDMAPFDARAAAVTLNFHSKTFYLKDTEGSCEGTVITDGALTLADGAGSGVFTSEEADIGPFDYAVASWNAQTHGGSISVELCFELTDGAWSDYYSWGVWSSKEGVSGSRDKSDKYGGISVDTLTVNEGFETTGKVRFRVSLTAGEEGAPVVTNVSFTTPQMAEQCTVGTFPSYYLNEVPMRSQLAAENGSIGSIICSPTSTAMALEYMGVKVPSLTAAAAIYDNAWGAYGNWSFAAAYAGENGFTAYIDFYTLDMVKYALSRGVVLGCSTRLTSAGHIVLLTGYDEERNKLLVNDPNISENNLHVTEYDVGYFTERWYKKDTDGLGLVYVFQKESDLESMGGKSPADYKGSAVVRLQNASADGLWHIEALGGSAYALTAAETGEKLSVAGSDSFYLYEEGEGFIIRPSGVKDKVLAAADGTFALSDAKDAGEDSVFKIEPVIYENTDGSGITLTGVDESQYKIGAMIKTSGSFTAIYWGAVLLKPDGDGYTVAEKYACGEEKNVSVGDGNLLLAVHIERGDELRLLEGLSVGDRVTLCGVYPASGALAEGGYIAF